MNVNFLKITSRSFLAFLLGLALTACNRSHPIEKFGGDAQGTTYHISYWLPEHSDSLALKQEVNAEFQRLDKILSNYRPDSDIEQLNKTVSTEPQAVNSEIISLIEIARQVSVASDGCYDLSIKPLFDLWGFKDEKLTIPDQATIDATLKEVGFANIEVIDSTHLKKRVADLRIDLSSIAQGYSVAKIAHLLETKGIENYLVEIGGELQTKGSKPDGESWRVALEKPLPEQRTMHKIISIMQKEPLTVMTSGTYRHFFDANGQRYSHILDARTGKPVQHHTVSVTVLHTNPTEADAWSTALLCLGKEAGLAAAERAGIAALFIEQQGEAFNEFSSPALTALKSISIQ